MVEPQLRHVQPRRVQPRHALPGTHSPGGTSIAGTTRGGGVGLCQAGLSLRRASTLGLRPYEGAGPACSSRCLLTVGRKGRHFLYQNGPFSQHRDVEFWETEPLVLQTLLGCAQEDYGRGYVSAHLYTDVQMKNHHLNLSLLEQQVAYPISSSPPDVACPLQ